jgi:precorrin-6B methylase 2
MVFRKSLAAAAMLFAAVAAAQDDQPRRAPDVPFVPTTPEAVQAMLKLADVKATDVVYDLGCGDGRIAIAAAKEFGARAVGIDIDPQRIAEANANVKAAGVGDRVKIIEGDLFEADIREATVVTLFLLTRVNEKLRPRLMTDLRPGTRIVSNTFQMGDWKPEKELTLGPPEESSYLSHRLFLWIVPARSNTQN